MFNSYPKSTGSRSVQPTKSRSRLNLHKGYTLIEMTVVLAIVAILLSIAIPSAVAFKTNWQLKSVTAGFFNSLLFARKEAIMRNARVVMCKTGGGDQCVKTGGWEQGWIIFHDVNNDATLDASESVLFRQSSDPTVVIKGNNPVANYVSYNGTGVSSYISGAFQAGTVTVCSRSVAPVERREIVVNAGGRPRVKIGPAEACA